MIVVGGMELASLVVFDRPSMRIAALVIGPAMIAAGIFAFRAGGKRLCVYERGIADKNVAMPFDQISSYSFRIQEILMAGIHTQTIVTFQFLPRVPAGRARFRFSFQEGTKIDSSIETAHNHITAWFAEQMLAELRSGKPVGWTKSLTLRPEGVEYPGPGGTIKIAQYRYITVPVVQSSPMITKVHLRALDTDSVVATLTPDEFNFYPGILVLRAMGATATAANVFAESDKVN